MGVAFSTEEELFTTFQWQRLLEYTTMRESDERQKSGGRSSASLILQGGAGATPSSKDWSVLFSALSIGNEEPHTSSTLSGLVSMCSEMVKAGISPPSPGTASRRAVLSTTMASHFHSRFSVQCVVIPIVVYLLAYCDGRNVLTCQQFTGYLKDLEEYQEKLDHAIAQLEEEEASRALDANDSDTSSEDEMDESDDDTAGVPSSKRRRLVGVLRRWGPKISQRLRKMRRSIDEDEDGQMSEPGDASVMYTAATALCHHVLHSPAGHPSKKRGSKGEKEKGVGERDLEVSLDAMWRAAGDSSVLRTCATIIQAVCVIQLCDGEQQERDNYNHIVTAMLRLASLQRMLSKYSKSGSDSEDASYAKGCFGLLKKLETALIEQQLVFQTREGVQNARMQRMVATVQRKRELAIQKVVSTENSVPPGSTATRSETQQSISCNSCSESNPSSWNKQKNFHDQWETYHSQYVGQKHIWDALGAHFATAGAFDVEKPTVILLFGPSGYGKSELAKCVAAALHGIPISDLESSGKLVHIHMPSFCTKDSIYSLVDPPAAHIGDGILLSALRQHPDAVVVLDEFEKSTTTAVQHLWLSAFQKNGTLRSLKEASRSIGTTRTTFVLTCNLVADDINGVRDQYLEGDETAQATLRDHFAQKCKSMCTQLLGEPFVNRVDFFFPVVPYTGGEKMYFVVLVLERFLATQTKKGRHIAVTISCVETLASQLTTFHASTVEETVKPLILVMMEHEWTYAVLTAVVSLESTVDEENGGTQRRIVLVPVCNAASDANNASAQRNESVSKRTEQQAGGMNGVWETPLNRKGERLYWNRLGDGEEWLRTWFPPPAPVSQKSVEILTKDHQVDPSSSPSSTSRVRNRKTTIATNAMVVSHKGEDAEKEAKIRPSRLRGASGDGSRSSSPTSTVSLLTDKVNADTAAVLHTTKEMSLEKEVSRLLEVIQEKDMEIDLLKKKVLLLQKALGVLTLAFLVSTGLLSLVLGVKVTCALLAMTAVLLVVVLEVPLYILWDALKAVYHLLGPYRFFFLCAIGVPFLLFAHRATRKCR